MKRIKMRKKIVFLLLILCILDVESQFDDDGENYAASGDGEYFPCPIDDPEYDDYVVLPCNIKGI